MNMLIKTVAVAAVLLVSVGVSFADVVDDAMARAAERLLLGQQAPDGTWGEQGFTGEAAIGLVSAYQWSGDARYKAAAERAGDALIAEAWDGENYLGLYPSSTYAMVKLSEISADPANNKWRSALVTDFTGLSAINTANYFAAQADASSATYDMARLTVAASYLGSDVALWRAGLKQVLSNYQDNLGGYKDTAAGAATWALAISGDLSSSEYVSDDIASAWHVTLSSLPGMLGSSNAAEPTMMALLGLLAAQADTGASYSQIDSKYLSLASQITPNGFVSSDNNWYFFNGQALEVVPEPTCMALIGLGGMALLRRRKMHA